MQQMNALPKFLSQDTDIKRNDLSSHQDTSQRDKDFSNLVDQHIKKKESAEKNSRRSDDDRNIRSREAAKIDSSSNDNVADNGKSIINDKQQKQPVSTEAKKNPDKSDNQQHNVDDTEPTDTYVNTKQENKTTEQVETEEPDPVTSIPSETKGKPASEESAMLASEKFISLLYNSDQALTDNKSNNKAVVEDTDSELLSADEVAANKAQQKTIKSEVLTTNSDHSKKNDSAIAEHKLKVFANEVGDSKGNYAVTDDASDAELLTSKELLQRYQQQLQPKGKQELTKESLSKDKISESSVKALANKGLLKEQNEAKDAALSVDADIEPVEEELITTEQDLKKVVVKSDDKNKLAALTRLKAKQANDSITSANGVKAEKIADMLNDESSLQGNVISETGKVNQTELSDLANKESNKKSNKQNKELGINSVLKEGKAFEEIKLGNLDSGLNAEDEHTKAITMAVEQQKSSPQLATSIASGKTFQQNNANQVGSTQSVMHSMKLDSAESTEANLSESDYIAKVDDLAVAETELNLTNKEDNTSIKSVNGKNQTDNISRAFTDINAQAIQIKQANDAYSTYQNSEVLNHNVASDTAQIQKNNVQLHQETIAIFRKDFSDAVKDKVMLMVSQKLQQFDIKLDPPEFGNMQIRVNLQGEQAAVNFVVQNQQAKDALEQNMHKLRDMLAEQGVDVGDANVEQQNQQNTQGEEQGEQQDSTGSSLNNNAEKDSELHVLSANLFNSSATGVDYYA